VVNLNLFSELKKDHENVLAKLEKMILEILNLPKNELFKILPISNQNQHLFSEQLNQYLEELKLLDKTLKTQKKALSEIWIDYDKNLKLKSDKFWTESNLVNIPKVLEELTQKWKNALENLLYWQTNIEWLQSRFPEAKYNDVVGLCKLADRKEYAEEQDYSLNAGRYVGVEIEDQTSTIEEYNSKIQD
jgi:type I restriction enzyme M protein